MANEKISAMTTAGLVRNSDFLTIINTSDNFKVDRPTLLTDQVGEAIALNGVNGNVGLDSSSNPSIAVGAGGKVEVLFDGNTLILIDGGGAISIQPVAGEKVAIANAGSKFEIDSTGAVAAVDATGNPLFITFVSTSPTDWKTVVPNDMNDAINRISNFIAGTLGQIP